MANFLYKHMFPIWALEASQNVQIKGADPLYFYIYTHTLYFLF